MTRQSTIARSTRFARPLAPDWRDSNPFLCQLGTNPQRPRSIVVCWNRWIPDAPMVWTAKMFWRVAAPSILACSKTPARVFVGQIALLIQLSFVLAENNQTYAAQRMAPYFGSSRAILRIIANVT